MSSKLINKLRIQQSTIESDIVDRIYGVMLPELELIKEEYGDIPKTIELDIIPNNESGRRCSDYVLSGVYVEL